MSGKWPETRLGTELYGLNREFLELLRDGAREPFVFGLDAPVRQRLAGLSPAQLDSIARTPCLLASFSVLPPAQGARGVAEPSGPRAATMPAALADAARLFAASLLAWLWHTAHEDRLLAVLCIGPGLHHLGDLAGVPFSELQRAAVRATEHLEARFCRHPRLWPDLLRAASSGDTQLMAATRLSVVQLTLVQRVALSGTPRDTLRRPPTKH
ncbi:MAG: hypothetical protein KJ040_01030 [Gammaproteobacteria bacterium]|nr:hypothetical protein [Gammaproteobacteria bacterium]